MGRIKAGYTRRKNGLLQKQFTVNGHRYSVYGKTYKECDIKEDSKRNEIRNGTCVQNKISLNDYFEIIEKQRDGTVKPSTKRHRRLDYESYIKRSFGSRHIQKISKNDIYSLRSEMLSRGLNASTVNNAIIFLKSILRQAVDDEIISKNPCDGVSALKRVLPEARETIHRALSDDEISIFLKHANNLFYRNLCKFMLMTGVRCGEACALLWSDIDLDKGCIYISKTLALTDKGMTVQTPKTAKGKRVIPINSSILALLYEQLDFRKEIGLETNNVFFNTNGDRVCVEGVNSYIRRTLNNCIKNGYKIDKFTSHAFRDTFATKAIENGMQPETLQRILGHSNIGMTMNLYYHLSDEKKYNEMQLIDKAFIDV